MAPLIAQAFFGSSRTDSTRPPMARTARPSRAGQLVILGRDVPARPLGSLAAGGRVAVLPTTLRRTSACPPNGRLLAFGQAEVLPQEHERTPPLQGITSPVGPLNRISDDVRECRLGNLLRDFGGLARPVAKTRSEAVNREAAEPHALQNRGQAHVAKWAPGATAGKYVAIRAGKGANRSQ